MALFVRQDENRSKLQERLAAELQEKSKQASSDEGKVFDAERDSAYLKDTKTTTSLAWVWVLIGVAAVGLIIWFVIASS